jgi:hypothetical protein
MAVLWNRYLPNIPPVGADPLLKKRIDGTIKKRNDKNGCCSIYVANDKTFDSRKIQKFTGYNRKNSIEKS